MFSCVWKKIYIAGLRLLILEIPACKVGPWPASGNLDFRRIPTTLNGKGSSPYLKCANKAILLRTCFPARQGMSTWLVSSVKPGHWLSKELSWLITFPICCHNLLHDPCDSARRGLVNAHDWFSPDFTQLSFLFANFTLYSVTIINQSCDYNHLLFHESF